LGAGKQTEVLHVRACSAWGECARTAQTDILHQYSDNGLRESVM